MWLLATSVMEKRRFNSNSLFGYLPPEGMQPAGGLGGAARLQQQLCASDGGDTHHVLPLGVIARHVGHGETQVQRLAGTTLRRALKQHIKH